MNKADEDEDFGTNISNAAKKNYQKLSMGEVPWPLIIFASLSLVYIIYSAAIGNISNDRKLFGVIFTLLWALLWMILLWVLWREKHYNETWWLMVLAATMMTIFFILVIVLDL